MEILQLAEDLSGGIIEKNGENMNFVEIDIVRWEKEEEIPVVTIRALRGQQIQIEVNWKEEAYKEHKDMPKLLEEARREVIMNLLF